MSIDLGDFKPENVYNFLTFIYKISQKKPAKACASAGFFIYSR